jgi:hypothetical protein
MQAHDLQFTPGPRPSRRTLRAAPQVNELVDLRWEQVDFNHAVLQVHRVKKGTPAPETQRTTSISCSRVRNLQTFLCSSRRNLA